MDACSNTGVVEESTMQAGSTPVPLPVADPNLTQLEDSDWEYEYDDEETETFYVNLDLTSFNGPIRPPRRRQPATTTSATGTAASSPPEQPSSPIEPPDSPNQPLPTKTEDGAERHRFQLLHLHTRTPVVSYQNHIFECAWTDVLGTDLHFTSPQNEPSEDPTYLKHGKDYDLIAANSIKVVGRNAHLISASASAGRRAADAKRNELASTSQTQAGPVQPPTTKRASSQTQFVQRLIDAKRAKGETDVVRTAYSIRRGQPFEDRLRGWARTEERLARIQRLTHQAMEGDPNAIQELEEIYAQVEATAINANAAQTQSTAGAGTPIVPRMPPSQPPSGT